MVTGTSPKAINFYTTPTGGRFVVSEAVIAVITGPMGESKTWSGIQRWFYRAKQAQPYLSPGQNYGIICIRDTHENNKHSIVKTLNSEFFPKYPELKYSWRNDYRELWIDTAPRIFVEFFGIDDLPALTKLQGAVGTALIHLEECVPYTDSTRTNAGVSEDVFNAALVRCMRQTGVPGSLQMTFNPPDDLHWTYRRLLSRPDGPLSPLTPLITKEVFQVKPGENTWLPEIARQATKAAYEHDDAAYARFVLGEYATKYPGRRVAVNFNANWHVAQRALDPVEGLDGWISFDSWGHPAAVLGQQYPNGRILVLDVLQSGVDIVELIESQVKPTLQHPRWLNKCRTWRYMGDVTMNQPDQSNIRKSASQEVAERFADAQGREAIFEGGPSTWQMIKDGMLNALRSTIGGEPTVLIDPVHCKPLISSLKGAWHHSVNKSGVVNFQSAQKTEASHLGDCFANAMCTLTAWNPPRRWKKAGESVSRRRARSYAS
mgnify:FL=1